MTDRKEVPSNPRVTVDLSQYRNPPSLNKGASLTKRVVWHFVNAALLQNPLNPSSRLKILALKAFGARIGRGCLLKPRINIKAPWHITLGDHTWIGEGAWIDSLAAVRIGSHVCISQDVYLCCGNHDWKDPRFGKSVAPITIENGAWLAARSTIMGGVTIGTHAVVAAGSILTQSANPYTIYAGNPARSVKERILRGNISSGQ